MAPSQRQPAPLLTSVSRACSGPWGLLDEGTGACMPPRILLEAPCVRHIYVIGRLTTQGVVVATAAY